MRCIEFSGITEKDYFKRLTFAESPENNGEKKIGSATDADIVLASSPEIEDEHAVLKLGEESPFADSERTFRVENLSRYGVVIGRNKEFVMEPNTMEIFQVGNLLVQIARY